MRFLEVNPEDFVDTGAGEPANGRGAWTRLGIEFDYRYALAPEVSRRIGRLAETSLAHWAVAAGCAAITARLEDLGYLKETPKNRLGIFNVRVKRAVKRFQRDHQDPSGGAQLVVDGIVGRSDARALFTPLVLAAEARYKIPNRLLLGQTNHESALDPGAVGYYIYYGENQEYRGVDRGFSQINSRAHSDITWRQAFDPIFSLDYSGKRMRNAFDTFRRAFPGRSVATLWDAAVCSHNSPLNGRRWAELGFAPNEQAASYVAAVKNAIF